MKPTAEYRPVCASSIGLLPTNDGLSPLICRSPARALLSARSTLTGLPRPENSGLPNGVARVRGRTVNNRFGCDVRSGSVFPRCRSMSDLPPVSGRRSRARGSPRPTSGRRRARREPLRARACRWALHRQGCRRRPEWRVQAVLRRTGPRASRDGGTSMPSCFGSLQIDRRSGTWKPASTGSSAGLGALEDLVDVGGGAADQVGRVEGVKSTRPHLHPDFRCTEADETHLVSTEVPTAEEAHIDLIDASRDGIQLFVLQGLDVEADGLDHSHRSTPGPLCVARGAPVPCRTRPHPQGGARCARRASSLGNLRGSSAQAREEGPVPIGGRRFCGSTGLPQ